MCRKYYLFWCWFIISWEVIAQNQTTTNYAIDQTDFVNPERGFYRFTQTFSSNYSLLNQTTLQNFRTVNQTPTNASFTVRSTLIQRLVILDAFKSIPLSNALLNNLQTDLDIIRAAGLKVILRFFYPNPDMGCVSPYGDAAPSVVLQHIGQLKPIFHRNKDIIATVQMGFIGCWGEQYYSAESNFGDLSLSDDYNVPLAKWQVRTQVLDSLLSVVPRERMVQVRFPHFKQKLTNGLNAPSNTAPMMLSEAYNDSKKSRTGFHNDCFLAPYNDQGTYNYYPIGVSGTTDTTQLKPYMATDATYTVVGGETCEANGAISQCLAQGGWVEKELSRFKYSFLHADYNIGVLNTWTCMSEVKKRLGYRFELQSGTFTAQARPGQTFSVQFSLRNVGFAAPYNPRMVELVLRHTNGTEWKVPFDTDPRLWWVGQTHTVTQSFCLPTTMPTGTYKLLLHLPDPEPTLYGNPAYSIRLATLNPANSQSTWEASTGYNDLSVNLTVSGSAPVTAVCSTQLTVASNVTQPCPVRRLITDEFYAGVNKTYKAAVKIESKSTVNNGAILTLQAGREVTITSFNYVKSGAVFKTQVGGCAQ